MAIHSAPDETVYLTPDGLVKLREELKELIEVRRPMISEQIRTAKEDGDLSENGAYEQAKHDQSMLEGRIQRLEKIMRNYQIIEEARTDEVGLGSTVRIQDETGRETVYMIVGTSEARPRDGRISNESPVGRALIGHKAGEAIQVRLPNDRVMTYTIVAIE